MRKIVKPGTVYVVMCDDEEWDVMKDEGNGLRMAQWSDGDKDSSTELLRTLIAYKIIEEKKLEHTDEYILEINRKEYKIKKILKEPKYGSGRIG